MLPSRVSNQEGCGLAAKLREILRLGIFTADQYARATIRGCVDASAISYGLLQIDDHPTKEEMSRFEQISVGFSHVKRNYAADLSAEIAGRGHDDLGTGANDVTFFRRAEYKWEVMARIGKGSEIEELVTRAYPTPVHYSRFSESSTQSTPLRQATLLPCHFRERSLNA
jgi:hypothetical protein